jgi:CRISPR-associated protein Cas5t
LEFLVRVTDGYSKNSIIEPLRLFFSAPENIDRFGGLSCGESHHLVDQVQLYNQERVEEFVSTGGWVLSPSPDGDWACPVWVDHIGSAGTVWEKAMLVPIDPSFSIECLNDFGIDRQE